MKRCFSQGGRAGPSLREDRPPPGVSRRDRERLAVLDRRTSEDYADLLSQLRVNMRCAHSS